MDNQNLDFINKIVSNHGPVKVLLSAEKRSLIWLTLHTLIVAGIMYLIQPFRSTLILDFSNPYFILEIIAIITGIIILTYF